MANANESVKTRTETGASASGTPGPELTGRLGDFTVVRKIGAGAMGDVYLGKHVITGESVAIKLISDKHCLDEAFIMRFKREIDILMGLNHVNIARAVGYGVDQDRTFLALEYIEGPNLSDVLQERGALFEQDVLTIAMHVARGLASAYNEAGLVHRDIKPMNLLVKQLRVGKRSGMFMEDGDKVKIIDFGLAKPTDSEDQRLTITGFVMGTPAYMSPEQIRCEASLDFHTDMYALGATMFHLLTGRIPYPGNAPAIIMTGHLTQPVPDPGELVPSLSPETRKIVMTAMAKMARGRYSDFRAMISACEKALKDLSSAAPGTVRMLRKPMVRGGTNNDAAKQSTLPQGEDIMDFPALPTDKEAGRQQQKQTPGSHRVTAAHKRQAPSVTTSQIFKASPNVGGAEALEEKNPQGRPPSKPLPAVADAGSEALRRILTDKIEKARTTSRIRKNEKRMQALDLEVRSGGGSYACAAFMPFSVHLMAYLPGLFLLLVLAVLLTWLAFQQRA
ncbi:MAG TPA: serine/threonine-protein kinase [Planctomycetota bacterium]|nr:serine/threonine-protein kinase [Planctomycetota bacterium]